MTQAAIFNTSEYTRLSTDRPHAEIGTLGDSVSGTTRRKNNWLKKRCKTETMTANVTKKSKTHKGFKKKKRRKRKKKKREDKTLHI